MLRRLLRQRDLLSLRRMRGIKPLTRMRQRVHLYGDANEDFYWDKSLSCGPIVEQATHLCITIEIMMLIQAIYQDTWQGTST